MAHRCYLINGFSLGSSGVYNQANEWMYSRNGKVGKSGLLTEKIIIGE